jgi:hypothetical protein
MFICMGLHGLQAYATLNRVQVYRLKRTEGLTTRPLRVCTTLGGFVIVDGTGGTGDDGGGDGGVSTAGCVAANTPDDVSSP